MITSSERKSTQKTAAIGAWRVGQVVVGIGLDETDSSLLKYTGYFSRHVPVQKFCFLHVIPSVWLFDKENGMDTQRFDVYERDEETAREIAQKIARQIPDTDDEKIEFSVEEGHPLDEILRKADSLDADLIIIGKSTQRNRHNVLVKNLLRKSRTNVLLVPDKAKATMRKILVPFDFSPYSVQALKTAIAISKSFKIKPSITALHLYELPSFQPFMVRKTEEEMRRILLADRRAAFRTFLNNYIPAEDQNLIHTVILEQKHPDIATLLMQYASDNKNDLLIMGAKGHSKIGLLLLGSVTEKILSLTKNIPVLVIREAGEGGTDT